MESIQEYINHLDGDAKAWMSEFVNHMETNYPFLEVTMLDNIPTYIFDNTFIAFAANDQHFTLYTHDYYNVDELKSANIKDLFGKGCIRINYTNAESKPILFYLIHKIIGERMDMNLA
mgnify:CR=1 FL=1